MNAKWKCIKCGDIISSKCIWDRSIFHHRNNDVLLLHLNTLVEWIDNSKDKRPHIRVDLSLFPEYSYEENIDAAFSLISVLVKDKNLFKQMLCNHKYLALSEKPFVCCCGHTHANLEELK